MSVAAVAAINVSAAFSVPREIVAPSDFVSVVWHSPKQRAITVPVTVKSSLCAPERPVFAAANVIL